MLAAHATGDVVRYSTSWPPLLQKGLVSHYHASWLQRNISDEHGCLKRQNKTGFKQLNFSPVLKCLLKYDVVVGEGTLSPLSPDSDMCCGDGHTRKTTGRCAATSRTKGSFTTHQPSKNEQEIWELILYCSCNSLPSWKAERARNWASSRTLNTCLAQAQPSQNETGPSAKWGQDYLCTALASQWVSPGIVLTFCHIRARMDEDLNVFKHGTDVLGTQGLPVCCCHPWAARCSLTAPRSSSTHAWTQP